ncbi:MAG: DNA glycosylase [Clostridium sp.]
MITLEIKNFDLQQIADSGQCFRMRRLPDTDALYKDPSAIGYAVISGEHYLEISQSGNFFTFRCSDEEVPFWYRYFDLGTDYSHFITTVKKKDLYLQKAAEAGSGIHILNQDPWEMIVTFIISQQKTIPKIKETVEALSRSYGTKITVHESIIYAFPSAAQLCAASLEDLKSLKLGYRSKYIYKICHDGADGHLNLSHLALMEYEDAMKYLTGFYGIGTKVANCICLFGLHHINAFPVDTWIEQILLAHYYKKKYDTIPKNQLFSTIIKDNFSFYKGYAGLMQQYIFYYERLSRDKI